jgi:hypothetical protein
VQLLMPCRPAEQIRRVVLGDAPLRMSMHACSAGGRTWALAWADVGDPARVGPSLQALHASARANLGLAPEGAGAGPPDGAGASMPAGTAGAPVPLAVPGATPGPHSRRWRVDGRLPDGQAVQQEAVVFAYGTRIVQATVLGPVVPQGDAQTFLGSLRVGP